MNEPKFKHPNTTSSASKNAHYYAGARHEMAPFLPEGAKVVLDVGCGEGNFGALVKKTNNCEVWGIDIDAASVEKAAQKLDRTFVSDIATDLAMLPDDYFDAIFFNDVLEHLVDPCSLLEEMGSKLSSQGVIIASIPNVRYFRNLLKVCFRKDWEYEDSGVMDRTHLRFFTRKSIRRMFEGAGYRVIVAEGIGKTRSHKPLLMNILTFGRLGMDTAYLQFVIVASRDR